MTDNSLIPVLTIQQAAQAAQAFIADNVFALAYKDKSENTIRSLKDSAALWCQFLAEIGVNSYDLDCTTDPKAWACVNSGLLEAYQQWLLNAGYAINTVNRRVSAVRWYCVLASKAGVIPGDELAKIRAVELIRYSAGVEQDKKRETVRVGRKKGVSTVLTEYHVAKLKAVADERDRLIFCLMLNQAMRASEVIRLCVEDFNMTDGTVRFYRPKTKEHNMHNLTPSTLVALGDYLALADAPSSGVLIRARHRSGKLFDKGISTSALDLIVRAYGIELGLPALSAHDLRHSAATRAAKAGTPLKNLMSLGNWKSAATAERYIDDLTVHNEGVKGLD